MAKLYVDDVNVGVKQLYAELGIDPNSIPKKLARIFEINPNRLTLDEFRNEKAPRALGISTKFDVYSKVHDKVVTVRYAETERHKNENGIRVTTYKPAQLFIRGKAGNINDDVAFAYMYLHPSCQQSPFRKLNQAFRYLFKDNEAVANADLLREEQVMRAMSMIIGERSYPISQLRQLAKGMNIAGVDDLTDAELKNRLKDLAKNDPVKFFNDSRSNSIQFNGVLQDSVDKGILRIHTNNGFKRWHFYNEELCIINSGTDEMAALKEVVSRRMELIPQLQTALEGRTIESEINKPENQQYFDAFKVSDDVTKQEISPNIKVENKEVDAKAAHEADIKLLAEQEDAELAGTKAMHHQRKLKLAKYRDEVDAYRASLQVV